MHENPHSSTELTRSMANEIVIAIGTRNRETIVHRLRRANWPMWAVVSGGMGLGGIPYGIAHAE